MQPMSNAKKALLISTAIGLIIFAFVAGYKIEIPSGNAEQADPKEYTNIQVSSKMAKGDKIIEDDKSINAFTGDLIYGNKEANVVLIEYASLTCPHCGHFKQDIFPKLKKDYLDTNKILFIYRDYPLDPASFYAAKLARCGGVEKQKIFIDVLFDKQQSWANVKSKEELEKNLIQIGNLGGLQDKDIKECFTNKALEESILNSHKNAGKFYKIESTPTLIINNNNFKNLFEYDKISKAIDLLLEKNSN
jgi:protein-disulfide isomerase